MDALLTPWSRDLAALVAALRSALPPEETFASVPAGAERQREVVRRLAALLESDDSDAVDLIDAEADTLRAALGVRGFTAVADASHAYDFDKALTELNRNAETAALAR
jgi:hypothetical protein